MSPSFARAYVVDSSVSDAELCGQRFGGFTSGLAPSQVQCLRVGDLGSRAIFPAKAAQQPGCGSVGLVLRVADPSKVLQEVVRLVPVEMVDLAEAVGVWDEGQGDKPMDKVSDRFTADTEPNEQVPVYGLGGGVDMVWTARAHPSGRPSDPAVVGNNVTRSGRDWLPTFREEIVMLRHGSIVPDEWAQRQHQQPKWKRGGVAA